MPSPVDNEVAANEPTTADEPVGALNPRRLLPLAMVLPHSITAWVRAARRPREDVLPRSRLGARQIGELALDELVIAVNALVRSVPPVAGLEASVLETTVVGPMLAATQVHRTPAPLVAPHVVTERSRGLRFEHLQYETGVLLPTPLVARSGWVTDSPNGTAHARILRHRGAPRPWVICVHGVSQGRPDDLLSFRVRHLFGDLGYNVALPVLPLHGPRAVDGRNLPGFDILDNIAATVQAVADIRRLITWLRDDGDEPVAAYGVSLGGYIVSLLACLEPRIDAAIVAVPLVNMHSLLAWHLERGGGGRGRTMAAILRSTAVEAATAAVDPLRLKPLLPPSRLGIVAGLNDRVTPPRATLDLCHHWNDPPITWYAGSHVGHLWSGELRQVLDRSLIHLRDPKGAHHEEAGRH